MKKFVLTAPYTLEEVEASIPEISDSQVLLRINYFGICGSDIQMFHGLHKYMTYPVVIGHEVSANVEKTGKNVTGYKVGDLVTVEPQVFCGECWPCHIGRFNVCQDLRVMGVHQDGFACGYFAIDPSYLHPCHDMDPVLATLMEPLAVGIGAVKRAGDISGKNIVVVGAGTIGNLVAQSAQALGAQNVMVTDMKQKKLDYAKECGIRNCINTSDITLSDAIDNIFGKQRADIIIDCAATKGSFASILSAARPSSQIIVTGNFKAPVELEMPVLQRQEISLVGHMMYVREDFADAISFVRNDTVKLDGFITQQYKSSQLKEAFEFIDEHPDDVMKVVISMRD